MMSDAEITPEVNEEPDTTTPYRVMKVESVTFLLGMPRLRCT